MKDFPGLKIFLLLIFPLLLGACAVDRPPTGGPPDDTPLVVMASIPESGTLNVSPRTIRLDFSHYVGRDELARAIHFTPMVDDYEVEMHGKKAQIRLFAPLTPNRTYTLTLRNSLKSLYGKHQLGESWALAFSTGPVIDQGQIAGRVWSERMTPANGVTVMASPALGGVGQSPKYLAETGPAGEFRFAHLAPGNYRIVAITDRNGNLRFDPESESFATAIATPALEAGAAQPLDLRLSGTLSKPALRSCRTINDRELELTFSQPLAAASFDPSTLGIETVTSGKALPVIACFSPSRSSKSATWRLLTGVMEREAWYRLRPADGSPELTFPGSARTERYPALSVVIIPANGAEALIPETIRPGSAPAAELRFNLPVADASLTPQTVRLELTGKEASRPAPCTITRIDSRTFAVRPSGGFLPGRSYALRVNLGKIEGLVGTPAKSNGVASSSFTTADDAAYGEIDGSGKTLAGRVVVEARMPDSDFVKRLEARPDPATGEFSFSFAGVPPGKYILSAFIPSASSARWNAGSVEPFAPADPLAAAKAEVRAGWSTDGVRLDLPAPDAARPGQTKQSANE